MSTVTGQDHIAGRLGAAQQFVDQHPGAAAGIAVDHDAVDVCRRRRGVELVMKNVL